MPSISIMPADPLARLPRRTRRSFGIWRDTKAAWALTLTAWRHLPVHFATALLIWATLRWACLRALADAHPELGGTLTQAEAAGLLALALAADSAPLLLAAGLWPAQHRLILEAPAPALVVQAVRAVKMLGWAGALALGGAVALGLYLGLPLLLLPALGRVSTILSLILLLPAAGAAAICLLRLAFGLPAISLGLPRALAEGWEISRFHVTRSLCVCLLTSAPVVLALCGWLAVGPDGEGVGSASVRPLLDMMLVSLTGSLTGLFYRQRRLPPDLRPDLRPSCNRDLRREPIVS